MHTKRKYNIHKWEFSSFNSIVKMPARYCMDLISTHSIRKSDFCSAIDLWIQFCVPHLKNNLWALPSCKQDAFALLSMRLAKAVLSILTISLSCKMIVTDTYCTAVYLIYVRKSQIWKLFWTQRHKNTQGCLPFAYSIIVQTASSQGGCRLSQRDFVQDNKLWSKVQ